MGPWCYFVRKKNPLKNMETLSSEILAKFILSNQNDNNKY